MTPLKSIGGHAVQALKIDDLRMFCSKNGITGSRKAKKIDICWAICKAKEAYLSGLPAPYKGLIVEESDGPESGDGGVATAPLAALDGLYCADLERHKKRRAEAITASLNEEVFHPNPGRIGQFNRNEPISLNRRLVQSREETNNAIQLREMVESAATLRREIREEKDRRASLWRELVKESGDDETRAMAQVKAATEATESGEHAKSVSEVCKGVKGLYESLLDNVIEQDELIRELTGQHAALSKAVDRLIPKEKSDSGDVDV